MATPNKQDAAFPELARWYSTDIDILYAGIARIGVNSGGLVTAQASPNMTVAVAAGSDQYAATPITVASGNVTITPAHATLKRLDLIVVNTSAVKSAVAGTPAAIPMPPAIPANSVVHAYVFVPAADAAVNTNQILDKRAILPPSAAGGGFTDLKVKPSDESRTSNITIADDADLFFNIAANEVKFFELYLRVVCTNATGDIKYTFSVPAGCAIVGYGADSGSTSEASWSGHTESVGGTTMTDLKTTLIRGTDVGTDGFKLSGWVVNGATAGVVHFRWAQNTSDAAAVKVAKGSLIRTHVA